MTETTLITESSAKVRFRNGKTMYGVIANFLPGNHNGKNLWFIPNHLNSDMNPEHARLLTDENVADIDLLLK